jgi:3-isopropylmalate/(R)-2-methylmalate dehydratase small subunit
VNAFSKHRGVVAPFDRANVDTDQIIPKQFLKSILRTGFGDNLFDAWRYNDEGEIGKTPNERTINHQFVLNQARFQDASILLTRDNFGCGSSREHAVWALMEYGFRCVIAPSFADIFFTNSANNGLLLVVLDKEVIDELFACTERPGFSLEVDLRNQLLRVDDGESWGFDIDHQRKERLLRGLDDIGLTLDHSDSIREFEDRHRQRQPWLFRT